MRKRIPLGGGVGLRTEVHIQRVRGAGSRSPHHIKSHSTAGVALVACLLNGHGLDPYFFFPSHKSHRDNYSPLPLGLLSRRRHDHQEVMGILRFLFFLYRAKCPDRRHLDTQTRNGSWMEGIVKIKRHAAERRR